MKPNLVMFFSLFLFLKHLWKIFHSIHLFFLLFSLDTYKAVCIFLVKLSSRLPINSKIPRKIQEKMHFPVVCRTEFHLFSFAVYHGPTTKQTVKKLNLWRKTAVEKSAWIKVWLFQLARGLFILMDSAIICIYFRNTQPFL